MSGVFGNTATVTVDVNGDLAPERDETFQLVLSNPSSGTISDGSGQGTILNDDPPHVRVSDVSVNEHDGAAVFTVSLDGGRGERALRHRRRQRAGGPRLRREERHAQLRPFGRVEDRVGPDRRRRDPRGRRGVHARALGA